LPLVELVPVTLARIVDGSAIAVRAAERPEVDDLEDDRSRGRHGTRSESRGGKEQLVHDFLPKRSPQALEK
jgi:hypothetical protein